MSLSAEFITATVFAVIMVLIGLGAIWIVYWQTYFLLRHQGELLNGSLYIFLRLQSSSFFFICFLYCIVTHLSQAMIPSIALPQSTPSRLREGPSSSQPFT